MFPGEFLISGRENINDLGFLQRPTGRVPRLSGKTGNMKKLCLKKYE